MLICAAVSTSGQQRSACPVDLTSPTLVPVSLRPAAPGCGRDTMHGAPTLSEMAQVGQIDAFCPHLTTRSCCLASPSGGGISMNSVLQMTLRNWATNPLANLAQARARTRAYCFQTRLRRKERWQRTPDTDRATQRTACNVQHPAVRIIARPLLHSPFADERSVFRIHAQGDLQLVRPTGRAISPSMCQR
jgi:hypothetical protein